MRGKLAKALRREVKAERSQEQGVSDTGWIQLKSGRVCLAPTSRRAMYLKLKDKLKIKRRLAPHLSDREQMLAMLTSGEAHQAGLAPKPQRKRKPGRRIPIKLLQAFPSLIVKPLMYILQHRQPLEVKHPLTGALIGYEPHQDYASARKAADRGDGATVRRMAMAICHAG